MLCIIIEIISK